MNKNISLLRLLAGLGLWLGGNGLHAQDEAKPLNDPTIATNLVPTNIVTNTNTPEPWESESHRRDIVQTGSDVMVAKGETVRDVVVIRGNAIIDGEVEND